MSENESNKTNIFAVLSLVFSLFAPMVAILWMTGMYLWFLPELDLWLTGYFSFLNPVAIILGVISVNKIIKEGLNGRKLTVASFLIGTIPNFLFFTIIVASYRGLSIISLAVLLLIPSIIVYIGSVKLNRMMKNREWSNILIIVITILFLFISLSTSITLFGPL